MPLAEYRRKRNFDTTPEPTGKATKRRPRQPLKFVVQKHAARRLHYDFRLELDGVLVSWAVPKGPSLDPNERRLAVHVEDHPLDYGDFEGRIPEGEYGAGEVVVWDRGTWTPDGDPRKDLRRGRLEFHLKGQKLTGGWRLVRLSGGKDDGKDNWLLIKRNDESARDRREIDVVQELPQSVKSGKRVARNAAKLTTKGTGKRRARRANSTALAAADYPLALATLVKEPPSGKQWLHEIKLDGYRLLVFIQQQDKARPRARLFTRSQLDWTLRYPAVADAAAKLPVKSAVLDGELVAVDEKGVSRFQLLQNAAARRDRPLVFYAFDLLHLDGEDLRPRPLIERKALLARLISSNATSIIRYSDHVADQGPAFLAECCRRGLEGMIAKRADRPYPGGRTMDWLKVKCLGREELVIGGFTASKAAGRPLGALLVGYFDEGQLVYAGRVGTGFDAAALRQLKERLQSLRQTNSPFAELPPRERVRRMQWVRPQMVAQFEFGSWTDAGILRHASFQGLREDKPAAAVGPPESLAKGQETKRVMKPTNKRRQTAKNVRSVRSQSKSDHAPVALTNPQRVLFPDIGFTKEDLADYYASVADVLLPHVAGRPLSLVRCPEGIGQPCFFQKHATAGTPEVLRRVSIPGKKSTQEHLVVDSADGLRALAQMSILEIHPWGSLAEQLEQPDRLIFDLDPGPKVDWKAVVAAAVLVRDVLGRLDLESFVKTSGGKGLHVAAPLTGRTTWPALKQFARAIAEHLAQEQPDRYTAKMAKAARTGRVFIDYLRNDRGATAVAPFSPRAKAQAPVSMPVAWEDLSKLDSAAAYTVANAGQATRGQKRDPWRDFYKLPQNLPKVATR
ncbi:MAG TPA: DNA ligase D [Pirellulaceae bacterium]|nr:DNA ligase D [Pirellulaceae bacterium]